MKVRQVFSFTLTGYACGIGHRDDVVEWASEYVRDGYDVRMGAIGAAPDVLKAVCVLPDRYEGVWPFDGDDPRHTPDKSGR